MSKNFLYSHLTALEKPTARFYTIGLFILLLVCLAPFGAPAWVLFFLSLEGSQRVSHSSPIRLVNLFLFFLLSSSSLPLLDLTGAENTTLLITRKKSQFSFSLSLEATCYLSIGENRLLFYYGRLGDISAEEDHHLYPGS